MMPTETTQAEIEDARRGAAIAAAALRNAETAHLVALAIVAEYDVHERGDGWVIVCSRCDHRLMIKDSDRPFALLGDRHSDAHRFALRLQVEHYSRRHPEG